MQRPGARGRIPGPAGRDRGGPLPLGRSFAGPPAAFAALERGLHALALRTGEPGPPARVAAGLDLALRDLAARRAGLPVGRLLAGERRGAGRKRRRLRAARRPAAFLRRDALFERTLALVARLGRPVHLVDLGSASTLLRLEVVTRGRLLWACDPVEAERRALARIAMFQHLQSDQREHLAEIRGRGRVY